MVLEYDTWYHLPRYQQLVWSLSLRIFALWRHRWRHHSKIVIYIIICYVGHGSAAKVKLSFNSTTIEYGRRMRFRETLGTESELEFQLTYIIAIGMPNISFFSSWYFNDWRSYGRLDLDLRPAILKSLIPSLVMYYLEYGTIFASSNL